MRMTAHIVRYVLMILLCWGLTGTRVAQACAFHFYKPERTAIDWVIDTDHLVVARGHPDNPFAYHVVEILRGNADDISIPQLIDSHTRARFAANPDDGVLFAFDAQDGQWRAIAYLTPAYRGVIDTVLSGMATWKAGYDPARLTIFEALQDHPEPELRDLAIREIDKAPYDLLRRIHLRIPVDRLLADLWTPQGYPYQPIRILLLGLSGDDSARREVHEYIDRIKDWNWAQNLGAYATALVELDGVAGVALLEQELLSDPRQPLDKLEHVVEALAIHSGVGSDEIKSTITAALDRLIQGRPEAAPLIARQFGSRQDWALADRLAPLVAQRRLTNPSDLMTVAVYVAQAKAAGATLPGTVAQGG